jgi:hypothetical protein
MEKLWEEARENDQFNKLKLSFWLEKLINIDRTV